jgi:hypothetical protein
VPWIVLALGASGACSSTSSGTIAITLGGEPDALTRAPAPTALALDLIDTDGGVSSLGKVTLPATTADLTDVSQDTAGAVRISGTDEAGVVRVRGASLPVDFSSLGGATLTVFVQRTGETARMPSALTDAREAPLLAIASGRYVLASGGADASKGASAALYDLLVWDALPSPPTFPRAPASMAVALSKVLLVDDAGGSIFDLSDSTFSDVTLPTGHTFADLSGGGAVGLPDGSVYLVGATRSSAPSAAVLHMDGSADITFATLSGSRAGAAMTYVAGRGLVVFGGSATAPAVEILADDATSAVPTGFAPQSIMGATLVALDANHLVAAWASGTKATFFALDLTNVAQSATPVDATLPCSAKHMDLVALDAKTTFGVAEDGDSCAFTWDGATITPVALKVPRRGARAIKLPTGEIAIVGGSTTIESFMP